MIGQTVTFLVLVAVALAGDIYKPYENVDPNTLSCDPLGHEYLLLPHFSDCNKFYMCEHGRETEFKCPESLIFDFELQTCNWAWATKCILRTEEEEGSGGDGDDFISSFGESDLNVAVQPDDSNVSQISAALVKHFSSILNCNHPTSASQRLPYKGDCQRYWKCIDGVPQSVYCTDGLFFNERTQQCDFEANSKCIVETVNELQDEYIIYEKTNNH